MPHRARVKAAEQMLYRPNPSKFIHQQLASRTVIHLDLWALQRDAKPDQIVILLELRAGGRDPLLEAIAWLIPFDGDTAPVLTDDRVLRHYDKDRDRIKFNALSAADYIRLRDYHHDHIRPMVMGIDWKRARYKHVSALFHYFHVYDLSPFPAGFQNMHALHGKGPKPRSVSRKGWLEPALSSTDNPYSD